MALDVSTNVPLVQILGQWFKNYHAKDYKDKNKEVVVRQSAATRAERLDLNTIPEDAKQAIETAVYVTGTDKISKRGEPQTPLNLKQNLYYVGQIESEYITKKQYKGGPARSYWQVEPDTAKDLLKNAPNYFGKKFEQVFSKKYGQNVKSQLDNMSTNDLSNILEKDDDLAATFAAMKINQTYD